MRRLIFVFFFSSSLRNLRQGDRFDGHDVCCACYYISLFFLLGNEIISYFPPKVLKKHCKRIQHFHSRITRFRLGFLSIECGSNIHFHCRTVW